MKKLPNYVFPKGSMDPQRVGIETGDRQPATGNSQWRISRDAGSPIVKTGTWRVVSQEALPETPPAPAPPAMTR
jgi:hypothetical protein